MNLLASVTTNKVTIFFTRLGIYGLIAVMGTLYGLGKIKNSHEQLVLNSIQDISHHEQGSFTLVTQHIAVRRTGEGADYYRSLAADQLGEYQGHTLTYWTFDLRKALTTGTLPLELYFESQYSKGVAVHNFRVEGALTPRMISQSLLIQ